MNNANADYSTPTKRQRMEDIQKVHQAFYGISSSPDGGMPDTLRIGIQMKEFVACPPKIDPDEWISYMIYNLSDRLKNMWNLFMYFCLDDLSIDRINSSRTNQVYEVQQPELLTGAEENFYSNDRAYCKLTHPKSTYKSTELTNAYKTSFETWGSFIDTLIIDFDNLKNSDILTNKHGNKPTGNFRESIAPFFSNAFLMFGHLYNCHYGDLCSLGILLHFNSLFMNIVTLSDCHDIVKPSDETLGPNLYAFYQKILKEEAERVNSTDQ